MKDVLIYAAREDVHHKLSSAVPPDTAYCYWTVSGTPRQTGPGASVLSRAGGGFYAGGPIIEGAAGEVRFEPLERVDEELPTEPVTRGFKYVD